MQSDTVIAPVLDGWITDARGNRASVSYFGSEAEARHALDTLKNCDGCSNCSDCSLCSDCSDCSDCSNIAYLCDKQALKGDPSSDFSGPPAIPAIENIDAQIFAAAEQPGALRMDKWHTCGTTHCRAGWAVHLAGEAGYALERFHNTALAAQLIYRASGSPISPVRFFNSNEAALADMRKRASEHAAA